MLCEILNQFSAAVPYCTVSVFNFKSFPNQVQINIQKNFQVFFYPILIKRHRNCNLLWLDESLKMPIEPTGYHMVLITSYATMSQKPKSIEFLLKFVNFTFLKVVLS